MPWPRDAYVTAVWESELSSAQRLIALAYADHAGAEEFAWVTYDRLRARCGMSRDTVARAVAGLVEAGWLVLKEPPRQHYSARYWLRIPAQQSDEQTAEQSDDRTPESAQQSDSADQQSDPADQPSDFAPPTTPPQHSSPPSAAPRDPDADVRAVIAGVRARCGIDLSGHRGSAECIRDQLEAGWESAELARTLRVDRLGSADSPAAVLLSRLAKLGDPPYRQPQWCGECVESTRQVEDDDARPSRCPRCHPLRSTRQTPQRGPELWDPPATVEQPPAEQPRAAG